MNERGSGSLGQPGFFWIWLLKRKPFRFFLSTFQFGAVWDGGGDEVCGVG